MEWDLRAAFYLIKTFIFIRYSLSFCRLKVDTALDIYKFIVFDAISVGACLAETNFLNFKIYMNDRPKTAMIQYVLASI